MEMIGTQNFWDDMSQIANDCLLEIADTVNQYKSEKNKDSIEFLKPMHGYKEVTIMPDSSSGEEEVVLIDNEGNKSPLWGGRYQFHHLRCRCNQ